MTRVLIWVQHLLGTGHTVRAAALAHALRAEGAGVTMALGAVPPPTLDLSGLDLVELPAVAATDGSFTTIQTSDGRPYEAVAQHRRELLLALVETLRPQVLVTETFPFGRRRFSGELLAMAEAARGRGAVIASSIRDVLVRKSPQKEAQMAGWANAHFDHVLVHADPNFVRLEDSFGASDKVASLVHYTGFVDGGHPVPAEGGDRSGILVSAGGSAVGAALIEAAVTAARSFPQMEMRVLIPRPLQALADTLRSTAPSHVQLEANRPDFRALLSQCAVSISQAGYNTVLDVLAARPRAVLVPFAAHEESEQTDRAAALERRELAHVLAESDLNAETLAHAIRAALKTPPPPSIALDTDGAGRTARFLMEAAG
ncbi:MAG: glycosyltransferase [Pseudomonadota bacterium]